MHSTTASGLIITIRKRICGKVMFSQACVKNYVHGGRCTPPLDRHRLGKHLPHADNPLWADTPGHAPPLPLIRRYASYWNAFFFVDFIATGEKRELGFAQTIFFISAKDSTGLFSWIFGILILQNYPNVCRFIGDSCFRFPYRTVTIPKCCINDVG